MTDQEVKAKAVNGFKETIVPDCPYCHGKHIHNAGSEGKRMADCLKGEYILDYEIDTKTEEQVS